MVFMAKIWGFDWCILGLFFVMLSCVLYSKMELLDFWFGFHGVVLW
jgi:hypothetical protein